MEGIENLRAKGTQTELLQLLSIAQAEVAKQRNDNKATILDLIMGIEPTRDEFGSKLSDGEPFARVLVSVQTVAEQSRGTAKAQA